MIVTAIVISPMAGRTKSALAHRGDLARIGAIALFVCGIVAAVVAVPRTNKPGPGIAAGPIAALPAHCQLRNKSDMGGFIIATRPDVPVSADGRNDLFGLAGYAQNDWFTGTTAQAAAGVAQINREGTTCVIARNDSTIVPLLKAANWRVIGQDTGGIGLVASTISRSSPSGYRRKGRLGCGTFRHCGCRLRS